MPDRTPPSKTRRFASLPVLENMGTGSHPQEVFPPGPTTPPGATTRRDFFRLASASMALAGMGACGQPPAERIISHARTPRERVPGVPLFYATSMVLDGHATGLLVESHDGRPTKIEGNPDHPASLGATGAIHQASVLDLYDPLRADRITDRLVPRGWEHAIDALGVAPGGDGLRLLVDPVSSPTTAALLDQIRARFPGARMTFHAPFSMDAATQAARALFGQPCQPVYDFTRADRIVALDADFIDGMPFALRHARDFASRRRVVTARSSINRLYVAEPRLTPTGTLADERVACQARSIGVMVAALLHETVGTMGASSAVLELPEQARAALSRSQCAPDLRPWLLAAASDLRDHPGRSVVVVGPRQPWPVHLLAYVLNAVLGNTGQTVRYIAPTTYSAGDAEDDITDLLEDMRGGRVRQLIVSGVNPVHDLHPDLEAEAAFAAVQEATLHHGDALDETSRACRWMIPRLHYLESWGDARAWDGTISMIQPLVSPLRVGRTLDQLLAGLLGERQKTAHALLHDHWQTSTLRPDQTPLEDFMERALHEGVVRGSAAQSLSVQPRSAAVTPALEALGALGSDLPDDAIEVNFYPDAKVHDGRFATNSWLQELPDPNTKLTWGNAVIMSADLMRELEVEPEQVIEIELGGQRVRGPVLGLPGTAPRSVALTLGYGRTAVPDGFDVGFDAYPLRRGGEGFVVGARLVATSERRRLAHTQEHFRVEGREIALHTTLEEFRENDHLTEHLRGPVEHLFLLDKPYDPPQWGMVIDLSLCSGCSACVVACVAENNIPTVGEEGVRRGREMHWLRIDRYYEGDSRDVTVLNQPMLCQHCERAPCEYVCPVHATVHDPDGINNMIYNRCIGTRFCSNNCPYKVRRFNFFKYADDGPAALQKNPDVTVRERGVMEKCTYCVQRLRVAEIDARRRMVPVSSIEVETACQQACPTRAIAFGDITNESSEVRSWWSRPQRYGVLHDTGTEPRTQYLAKISNPGPKVS
jgi:Fe-S-cluster-containing dehydrogenase component